VNAVYWHILIYCRSSTQVVFFAISCILYSIIYCILGHIACIINWSLLLEMFCGVCLTVFDSIGELCKRRKVGGRKSIPLVKKVARWGAGMALFMERGAEVSHMVYLMPMPLHLVYIRKSKMVILLVHAYPGCPGKKAVGWVYMCLSGFPLLTSSFSA